MTNYEKYFGTIESAAVTLYSMKFCTSENFARAEEMMKRDFLGGTVYKHNADHLKRWQEWLQEECDE